MKITFEIEMMEYFKKQENWNRNSNWYYKWFKLRFTKRTKFIMDKTKELRTLNTKTKMREVTTYLFS